MYPKIHARGDSQLLGEVDFYNGRYHVDNSPSDVGYGADFDSQSATDDEATKTSTQTCATTGSSGTTRVATLTMATLLSQVTPGESAIAMPSNLVNRAAPQLLNTFRIFQNYA